MKMEKNIARRMVRNILISVFIYALPIVLMLLTFYISGQRPWKAKSAKMESPTTQINH